MTVTPADLAWWLTTSQRLVWREAKSYADSAPHAYVTIHDDNGLTREDYRRAARVIHTFGEWQQFYGHRNLYLTDPVTGLKWWHMDGVPEKCDLINQAPAHLMYGWQHLPRTYSAAFTYWDGIALNYDRMPRDEARDADALDQVRRHFDPDQAPLVLDLGAGTGWSLDTSITSPHRLWAIDSSQAMMNELLRKHPQAHPLVARAEDVALRSLPPRFDLLLAVDVPTIPIATLARFAAIADYIVVAD